MPKFHKNEELGNHRKQNDDEISGQKLRIRLHKIDFLRYISCQEWISNSKTLEKYRLNCTKFFGQKVKACVSCERIEKKNSKTAI